MACHSRGSSTDVPFSLHAELLPNIRQITLHFSQTPTRALNAIQPKFQLSDSGQEITVSLSGSFQNDTQTITLPARVSDATQQILKTDASPSAKPSISPNHEYSIRMQIDPKHLSLTTKDGLTDDYVPWTAMDMSHLTRIRCRFCRSHLLKARSSENVRARPQSTSSGWEWKDLPSGNWAEMMDFWHCHKPDSLDNGPPHETNPMSQTDDNVAEVKGYGAASRVKAIPGTVLIDVATFLLAESDCVGLKKIDEAGEKFNPKSSSQPTIQCINCNAHIGMQDSSFGGWRLLKANVSLNTNALGSEPSEEQWRIYSAEVIVAAQLLESILRENTRRFLVHKERKTGLLLWVFNPDLHYSHVNAAQKITRQEAMKVFFQVTNDIDSVLTHDLNIPSSLSMEELELPPTTFEAVSAALFTSHAMLPPSARNFKEWKVGLLNRFSRDGPTPI